MIKITGHGLYYRDFRFLDKILEMNVMDYSGQYSFFDFLYISYYLDCKLCQIKYLYTLYTYYTLKYYIVTRILRFF